MRLAILIALLLPLAATSVRADDAGAAQRAEQAATRAESAASRSEAAASRTEAAINRLEHTIDAMSQPHARHRAHAKRPAHPAPKK